MTFIVTWNEGRQSDWRARVYVCVCVCVCVHVCTLSRATYALRLVRLRPRGVSFGTAKPR